ncbi:hypothetical protein [Microbacterium resistens]|uniref:hypothetical protein n=1 Tax=Microbacterium resistens TaxID=156977 RepID=UPI003671EEDE
MPDRRAELERHLNEQLHLLDLFASAYDEGSEVIMLPASVTVRNLVHTTGRSTSLLHQLGVIDEYSFMDGVPEGLRDIVARGDGFVPGLAIVDFGPLGARYVPAFRSTAVPNYVRQVPFEEWWKTSVSLDFNGHKFSRRNVILATANKDGGGHVDLDKGEYANIPRDGFPGVGFGTDGRNPSPVPAMIRQIVEEVRIGGRTYLAHLNGAN